MVDESKPGITRFVIKKLLDTLYDGIICGFSLLDIVCDLLIAREFYVNKHYKFFYASIFIFILAQITYSVILALSLVPTRKHKDYYSWNDNDMQRFKFFAKILLIVFPFGQLIPLLLMVQDMYIITFTEIYGYFGYKSNLISFSKENSIDNSNNDDQISSYIKKKWISHLGFITEAIIEAVPQSILQVIFIIIHKQYNYLNMLSIIMSIIVIASKGSLLCYNIQLKVAIFNFFAFSIDIFGIFALVSWLFCINDDINMDSNDDGYIIYGYPVWKLSYLYFRVLYMCMYPILFLGCIGILFMFKEIYYLEPNRPWKQWPLLIIFPGAAILLFFPGVLVVLIVRFTLIPLLLLQSVNHKRYRNISFHKIMFNFLCNSKSFTEMHEKLLITNWQLGIFGGFQKIIDLNGDDISLINIYYIYNNIALSKWHEILNVLYYIKKYNKEFYQSLLRIRNIIGFKENIVSKLLTQIRNYQYIAFIKHVYTQIKNKINTKWRLTWKPTIKRIILDKLPTIFTIYLVSFILAVLQDITNVVSKIMKLKRYQLLRWKLPAAWVVRHRYGGYGSHRVLDSDSPWMPKIRPANEYIIHEPIILEGLFTYFVCFGYYLIHIPLRDLFRSKLLEGILFWCTFLTIILCILPCIIFLLFYSLFLPLLFGFINILYYGISINILQLILTLFHGFVFIGMILLLPYVIKFIYCDIHLHKYFDTHYTLNNDLAYKIINIYQNTPKRNQIIINKFGNDIGSLLLQFLPKWNVKQ